MKSALLVQLGATALLAAAQPGVHRRHAELHEKRDTPPTTKVVKVVVNANYIVDIKGDVTETRLVTEEVVGTEVSVMEAAVQTSPSVPAPAPAAPASTSAAPSVAAAQYSQAPSSASSPAASSGSPAPSTGGNSAPSTGIDFSGQGIIYSPFASADGTCYSNDQITRDLQHLAASYSVIRVYGVLICSGNNFIDTAINALQGTSARLMVSPDSYGTMQGAQKCLGALASQVNGRWQYIHSIITSNEAVARGNPVGSVVSNFQTWSSSFRSAGFKGPISIAEPSAQWTGSSGSQLSGAVFGSGSPSFCAANIHAYFTPGIMGDRAAFEVNAQRSTMVSACQGKTIVAESGWPWGGFTSDPAKSTPAQQALAIAGLRSSVNNVMLFMANNDPSKAAEGNGADKLGIPGALN